MQAEHIPVHLGSMPDAVAAVLDERAAPGRPLDPQRPLPRRHPPARRDPDLAAVRADGGELIGFAASRAHHADIGGPTPGGMPADSTRSTQEGVVIAPTRADDEVLRELAEQMRKPEERLADLRAQRAANLTGARRVGELVERHGADGLDAGMAEILDYSERRTRRGDRRARRRRVRARATCSRAGPTARRARAAGARRRSPARRCELDFTGSAEQVEGNLNCPLSVTKSAAFFAVRVLTDPDAPPSAGAHRPVEVIAPPGCAAQRARRRRRSPPATSRPRAGSPTWCSPRSRAPSRLRRRARGR